MTKQISIFVLCLLILPLCGLAQNSESPESISEITDWTFYDDTGISPLVASGAPTGARPLNTNDLPLMGALLIPNSNNETVMAFDPVTGDLIDHYFFPENSDHLSTPLYVIWNHDGTSLLISDQVESLVQQFDPGGSFEGTFAPSGGHDTDILANIRAILHRDNGNLLVCVGGGGNAHAIAEFDTNGNYLGNFVDNEVGGLDRPFGMIYRPEFNDYLVAANGSAGIHRYDEDGNFIGMFGHGHGFPQQINMASNGNILVANHTIPSGVTEYDSQGEVIEQYDIIGGLRGVHELNNGNLLVTGPSGVYEISRDNQMIGLKAEGNARHITYIRPSDIDYYAFNLEMNPADAGVIVNESGNFSEYPEGYDITLTAEPDIFHEFESWTDHQGNTLSTEPTFTYTMPSEEVTITANFSALDIFTVTFLVLEDSGEEIPVDNASVLVEGFDVIYTDHAGEAELDLPVGTFSVHVNKQGYIGATLPFSVSNMDLTVEVRLMDNIIAPPFFEVTQEGYELDEALLTWLNPALFDEFRYDDGQKESTLGFQAGDINSVMGAAHHYDALIKEVTWYTPEESVPSAVKLWVLGLDENGIPDDDNELYTAEGVIVNHGEWNRYTFDTTIEAPNGFYIGLSASSPLLLAIDDGEGEPWDFIPNTHYGNFNISEPATPFTPIEDWGFTTNFLIRAYGENHGELNYDPEPVAENSVKTIPALITNHGEFPVTPPMERKTGKNRAYLGTNVFLNDMETPIAYEITDTEYLLTGLPPGEHIAGVQSVYTTGVSEIANVSFEIESGDPVYYPLPFYDDFEAYLDHSDFINNSEWTILDATEDGSSWLHHYDSWDDIHVMASASKDPDTGDEIVPYNFLVMPGLQIPAARTEEDLIQLQYYVAAAGHEDYAEHYKIVVSTTGNSLEDFQEAEPIFEETLTEEEAAWNFAFRNVDLHAFENQEVHIAFVHYDSMGMDRLLIREVGVGTDIYQEPVTYDVVFNLDMSHAEGFDPDAHHVYISGGFGDDWHWAEPGTVPEMMLEQVEETMQYAVTLPLERGEYSYKYFSDAFGDGFDGGEWDAGEPDREIGIYGDKVLNDIWGVPPGEVPVKPEPMHETGISVHPNPATTYIHIHATGNMKKIQLVGVAGNIIVAETMDDRHHQIHVGNLNNGLYFLKITTSSGTATKKIMISK